MIKNMFKNMKKEGNDIEKLKERFKDVTQKNANSTEPTSNEIPNIPTAEPMKEVPLETPITEPVADKPSIPPQPPVQPTIQEQPAIEVEQVLEKPAQEIAVEPSIPENQASPIQPAKEVPIEQSSIPENQTPPIQPEVSNDNNQQIQNVNIVDVNNLDNNEPESIKVPVAQKPEQKPDQMNPKTQEIVENVEESFEDARMNNIIMQQLKELIEIDNSLNGKIKDVEKKIGKEMEEKDKLMNEIKMIQTKLQVIEKSMDQFMTLYEVVTNQFNPFVNQNEEIKTNIPDEPKPPEMNQPMQQPQPIFEPQPTQPQQMFQQQPIQQTQPVLQQQPVQQTQPIFEQQPVQQAQPVFQQQPVQQAPQQIPLPNQDIPMSIEPIHKVKEELNQEKMRNKVHESHKTLLNNTITKLKSQLETNQSDLLNHKVEKEKLHKELIAHKEELNQHKADLEKKNQEVELHKTEKEEVKKHLHNLKQEVDTIKIKKQNYVLTDPSQFFHLKNGKTMTSLNDLVLFLSEMDDETFTHHINTEKNDFAIWVNDTLKDEDLAVQLIALTDRKQMIKTILEHIN